MLEFGFILIKENNEYYKIAKLWNLRISKKTRFFSDTADLLSFEFDVSSKQYNFHFNMYAYCSNFRNESNGIFVLWVGFFSSDKFRFFN